MPNIPNNTDWSATAAWIALAISILVPFFTCIVNAIYQTHLKKIELCFQKENEYYQKQVLVFQKLITIACLGFGSGYESDRNKFKSALNESYLFMPSQHWTLLHDFNIAFYSKDCEKFDSCLQTISKIMGETLQAKSASILK